MKVHGKVLAVTTRPVGAEVSQASTGVLVRVRDASMFDVTGGTLAFNGVEYPYVAADPNDAAGDSLTLAAPLTVEEGDRLALVPVKQEVVATVRVWDDGEPVPAVVPLTLRKRIPEGVRDDPATAETVIVDLDAGSPTVVDIVGDDGNVKTEWQIVEGGAFIAGDPDGVAAEMRADGLSLYAMGPGGRYQTTTLGSGQDRLGVFNAEGQVTGGVTADGDIVGQSGAIAGDLSVGGTPLMGRLWDNSPGAPVGWFERFSAGHVVMAPFEGGAAERPADEAWGYAKVGFTARAGRSYSIRVEQALFSAGTYVQTYIRATTDGSEPTIFSDPVGDPAYGVPAGGAVSLTIERLFTSPTDVEVVAMVSNVSFDAPHTMVRATITVEDKGPQGVYGGGTYTTGRETTPPPTVREYTATWTCSDYGVFDESAQPMPGEPVRQWSWTDGARVSTALAFTGLAVSGEHAGQSMTDATAGATLLKAEVFLANTSWFGLNSGTAALGKGGFADVPLTLPNPQATVEAHGWPTGAGQWVQVPTSWFSDTNRVVTLGDADGGVMGGWFMGPADDFPPQVRLTYSR